MAMNLTSILNPFLLLDRDLFRYLPSQPGFDFPNCGCLVLGVSDSPASDCPVQNHHSAGWMKE